MSRRKRVSTDVGAEDLREMARIIARMGCSRSVFMGAIRAVFVAPNAAEVRWLHRAWKEAKARGAT